MNVVKKRQFPTKDPPKWLFALATVGFNCHDGGTYMKYLLACILVFVSGWSAFAAPPPNILFIMSDDHARARHQRYGSKVNQTPNLDRLAHEGMRFDRLFSASIRSARPAAPRSSPANTAT